MTTLVLFILIFLVEAAVALTFVSYFLIRGMLAQVANARGRRAQGRLLPAVGQGVLWAEAWDELEGTLIDTLGPRWRAAGVSRLVLSGDA